MRRCGGSPEFVFNGNNEVHGLLLPADFVAEHEWGIGELKDQFGIPSIDQLAKDRTLVGIKGRTATSIPDTFRYLDCDLQAFMLVTKYSPAISFHGVLADRSRYYLDLDLVKPGEETREEICGSWADGDFGVAVGGVDNMRNLHEIKKAIERLDIAVFLSNPTPGSPSARCSLCFYIVSRTPESVKELMKAGDLEHWKLMDESDKTGIKSLIHRSWYIALSPKKIDAEAMKIRNTAFPLLYWLNPMNQSDHEFGWWTVEELREWHKGRGPILKAHVEQATT